MDIIENRIKELYVILETCDVNDKKTYSLEIRDLIKIYYDDIYEGLFDILYKIVGDKMHFIAMYFTTSKDIVNMRILIVKDKYFRKEIINIHDYSTRYKLEGKYEIMGNNYTPYKALIVKF